MAQKTQLYSAAHFALELDGKQDVGLFRSIEGGGLRADVMTYQYGHAYEKWRQLGKPKFEDVKVQIGMAMSKPFYDWIEKFFDGEAIMKNGAIVAADYELKERARREFTNAMIKELTFPQLVAKDSTPVYMTVTLAMEGIVFAPGKGRRVQVPQSNAQKEWTASRFRLVVDGLDRATKNCSKIEAFTIKQNVIDYHSGGFRAPIKCASTIDFPNLVFFIPEADAQPFYDRAKSRITDGEMRTDSDKASGYIQTYDPHGKPLFTLEFFQADVLAVTPDKSDVQTDEAKQVKVELFTEKMKFSYAAMEVV